VILGTLQAPGYVSGFDRRINLESGDSAMTLPSPMVQRENQHLLPPLDLTADHSSGSRLSQMFGRLKRFASSITGISGIENVEGSKMSKTLIGEEETDAEFAHSLYTPGKSAEMIYSSPSGKDTNLEDLDQSRPILIGRNRPVVPTEEISFPRDKGRFLIRLPKLKENPFCARLKLRKKMKRLRNEIRQLTDMSVKKWCAEHKGKNIKDQNDIPQDRPFDNDAGLSPYELLNIDNAQREMEEVRNNLRRLRQFSGAYQQARRQPYESDSDVDDQHLRSPSSHSSISEESTNAEFYRMLAYNPDGRVELGRGKQPQTDVEPGKNFGGDVIDNNLMNSSQSVSKTFADETSNIYDEIPARGIEADRNVSNQSNSYEMPMGQGTTYTASKSEITQERSQLDDSALDDNAKIGRMEGESEFRRTASNSSRVYDEVPNSNTEGDSRPSTRSLLKKTPSNASHDYDEVAASDVNGDVKTLQPASTESQAASEKMSNIYDEIPVETVKSDIRTQSLTSSKVNTNITNSDPTYEDIDKIFLKQPPNQGVSAEVEEITTEKSLKDIENYDSDSIRPGPSAGPFRQEYATGDASSLSRGYSSTFDAPFGSAGVRDKARNCKNEGGNVLNVHRRASNFFVRIGRKVPNAETKKRPKFDKGEDLSKQKMASCSNLPILHKYFKASKWLSGHLSLPLYYSDSDYERYETGSIHISETNMFHSDSSLTTQYGRVGWMPHMAPPVPPRTTSLIRRAKPCRIYIGRKKFRDGGEKQFIEEIYPRRKETTFADNSKLVPLVRTGPSRASIDISKSDREKNFPESSQSSGDFQTSLEYPFDNAEDDVESISNESGNKQKAAENEAFQRARLSAMLERFKDNPQLIQTNPFATTERRVSDLDAWISSEALPGFPGSIRVRPQGARVVKKPRRTEVPDFGQDVLKTSPNQENNVVSQDPDTPGTQGPTDEQDKDNRKNVSPSSSQEVSHEKPDTDNRKNVSPLSSQEVSHEKPENISPRNSQAHAQDNGTSGSPQSNQRLSQTSAGHASRLSLQDNSKPNAQDAISKDESRVSKQAAAGLAGARTSQMLNKHDSHGISDTVLHKPAYNNDAFGRSHSSGNLNPNRTSGDVRRDSNETTSLGTIPHLIKFFESQDTLGHGLNTKRFSSLNGNTVIENERSDQETNGSKISPAVAHAEQSEPPESDLATIEDSALDNDVLKMESAGDDDDDDLAADLPESREGGSPAGYSQKDDQSPIDYSKLHGQNPPSGSNEKFQGSQAVSSPVSSSDEYDIFGDRIKPRKSFTKGLLKIRPSDYSSTNLSDVTTWWDKSKRSKPSEEDGYGESNMNRVEDQSWPKTIYIDPSEEKDSNESIGKSNAILLFLRGDGLLLRGLQKKDRDIIGNSKTVWDGRLKYGHHKISPSLVSIHCLQNQNKLQASSDPDHNLCLDPLCFEFECGKPKPPSDEPETSSKKPWACRVKLVDEAVTLRDVEELADKKNKQIFSSDSDITGWWTSACRKCPLHENRFHPFFPELFEENGLVPLAERIIRFAVIEGTQARDRLFPLYTEEDVDKVSSCFAYDALQKGTAKFLTENSLMGSWIEMQSESIFTDLMKDETLDIAHFATASELSEEFICAGRRALIIHDYITKNTPAHLLDLVEDDLSNIEKLTELGRSRFSEPSVYLTASSSSLPQVDELDDEAVVVDVAELVRDMVSAVVLSEELNLNAFSFKAGADLAYGLSQVFSSPSNDRISSASKDDDPTASSQDVSNPQPRARSSLSKTNFKSRKEAWLAVYQRVSGAPTGDDQSICDHSQQFESNEIDFSSSSGSTFATSSESGTFDLTAVSVRCGVSSSTSLTSVTPTSTSDFCGTSAGVADEEPVAESRCRAGTTLDEHDEDVSENEGENDVKDGYTNVSQNNDRKKDKQSSYVPHASARRLSGDGRQRYIGVVKKSKHRDHMMKRSKDFENSSPTTKDGDSKPKRVFKPIKRLFRKISGSETCSNDISPTKDAAFDEVHVDCWESNSPPTSSDEYYIFEEIASQKSQDEAKSSSK